MNEQSQLEQYRDQLVNNLASVQLAQEIRQLEQALRMDTYRSRLEESADYITSAEIRRETGFGEPRLGVFRSQADDYLDGQCRPLYENELQLQELRGIGRYLTSCDETGACIMANLRNYTIGEGFETTAVAKDEEAGQIASDVQAFLDEFNDRNGWEDEGEAESFLSSVRDGEHLLWLQSKGSGAPLVRHVTGEHLTEPGNPREVEDYHGIPGMNWRFGVATDQGDPSIVHGYFANWFGSNDWDFIPEAESVFIKRNTPRMAKRGVSDFAIPFKALDRGGKLFDRVALQATIQASIAFIIKAAAGTPASTLTNFLDQNGARPITTVGADNRAQTVTGENFMGGRVIRTNGHDYQAGPTGTPQGPVFMDILQGIYRRVGSRWCMPEYMISGDASNANYSSTLVSGSPFVQEIRHTQGSLVRKFRELLWKAVDMAAQNGRFGGLTVQELKASVEIQIEPPEPEINDPEAIERIMDAQQRAGVLSRKTRAARSGLDFKEELANGAKEATPPAQLATVASSQMAESRIRDIRFSLLEGE